MLYRSHCYPSNAIGPAQYVWRPESMPSRQLWLIIHPAITGILVKEINANVKALPNSNVMVTNLQDELVHYRLLGACCNDVITRAIDPVWSDSEEDRSKWWMSEDDGCADKKKFFKYFSCTKTPAKLPNKIIVGLTVKDFRLSLPDKKLNISLSNDVPANTCNVPEMVTPKLSHCHIWNKAIREHVKQAQVPEYTLNEMKSRKLCDVSEELVECHLPLLLLHQAVNGVGVGWDILVPAGWGKPFWLSLVYHGARVVGFDEMKQCHLEQSILHYPIDYPDTDAGHQLELNNLKMLQSQYCRYPPDKRPNFGKINSPTPFLPAWSLVIGYHSNHSKVIGEESVDDTTQLPTAKRAKMSMENSPIEDEICYYVLRSVKCLMSLSRLLNSLKTAKAGSSEEAWLSLINDLEVSTITMDHALSLVAVSFTMCHRGNPSARSMLCIPSVEDLVKLLNDKDYYGPVELLNKKGVCILHNEQLVIGTTSLTNKEFKMAKRHNGKGLQPQLSSNAEDFSYHGNVLDDISATLRLQPLQSCRPIIGYVTSAGYVFSQGMGSGIGFCSLLGLMKLMKLCYLQNHPVTLLVREHNSRQYRFAYFKIIQNIV